VKPSPLRVDENRLYQSHPAHDKPVDGFDALHVQTLRLVLAFALVANEVFHCKDQVDSPVGET
jgi:hypothetical protein